MSKRISLETLRSVNLTLFDGLVSITLIGIAFLLPYFTIPEADSLISAASAIFAIVSGFFIADATANYLRLQTLISEENGIWISITHDLHWVGAEDAAYIRGLIDTYMIAQLDIDGLDHTITTHDEFNTILNALDHIIETYADISESMKGNRDKLITLNQEMVLAANSNLTLVHWGIIISLWMVVAITTLSLRDGTLTMFFIAAGILLGCQGVMVVLRDVDNNRYLQRKLSFKNPRFVFQAIGRPPYYSPASHKAQQLPNESGELRMRDSNGVIQTKRV
jgi:hypothetical protein